MNTIDCRGLECPMPVINTKKYFEKISSGEAKVITDNEISKNNLEKFALGNGFDVTCDMLGDDFVLIMKKSQSEIIEESKEHFSILIGSDKLGTGDDSLGQTLMKSYIYALSESDKMPRKIMFLNSGVKLVSSDSKVLESLELMKNKGVEICSCGVCLEFFGIKDDVRVGEITNMYSIVEEMNSVSNLIKL
ncbi:sulfurtransferase-like selenium metabolism protein YedF [uncultured Clostridium sp.]|uniref:sulfurtransferase-like selenium metabolism protein YedF n=1 Tax=uncultured Clostridium sp. TaxID=59620 RepID=UPI00260EE3BD|nr:sulfurtransferase-like selenium metabolism protein YedF [uncultured Clostridium sp.]